MKNIIPLDAPVGACLGIGRFFTNSYEEFHQNSGFEDMQEPLVEKTYLSVHKA